jgi:hypothetical protein
MLGILIKVKENNSMLRKMNFVNNYGGNTEWINTDETL